MHGEFGANTTNPSQRGRGDQKDNTVAMRTKDPKMSRITVQTPKQKGNDPDADDFGQRTPGTQIRSGDTEGTLRRRGDRTMVDTVRGGRSRLSCLGLGLVSERALSRLLGG